METLREGWAEYESGVIPEGFSDDGREVVRHAFYHGAIALMMIGDTYRRHGMPEDERQALLGRVVDEIVEFEAGCETKMLLHVLASALQR
ncbi:hypothetical protein [Burkholderia pseudomallei]|uniref:hypothetical protein n=1 Tax=Burkholderia pseudomallei TaxID=28450 RepID=UPI00190DC90B|nr:hypothetical protein [Burkholderia pseudomallei]MBK3333516.1 hypothetical protein [Burkholderia pseudomallei]